MRLPAGALCALCYCLATAARAAEKSPFDPPDVLVNTAGTVRMNCLANLEALLNIAANGIEITGILISAVMLIRAMIRDCNGTTRLKALVVAMLPLVIGLSTPGVMNWLVAAARDANLFSFS